MQQQLEYDGVPWRPGARELLAALRQQGTKTALVTMSVTRMAEQIVGLIGFDAFDLLVTGDRVE
ncbi:HAD family hydrolase, partial [Rhizobium johnstonii]|uniref:HAD family hydrolase n=1 Tax=Rhizobium johnstonii TaxID=3019933 RepID=UPI003F9812F7